MAKQVKSAAQSAQNWQSAMGAPATRDKYAAGVARVTVSPTQQAASPDAEQRYVQGVQQAVQSGKRAAALNKVSLQDWQKQATQIGAQRLQSGAQKGQSKVQQHHQNWQSTYQAASDAAAALPKGGMANARARWEASTAVLMAKAGKM